MPSSPTRHDLDWVDGFVARIRPHVRVRLSDRVLIHMPNRAFKLNRTGARLLHHLLEGKSVRLILEARPDDGEFHSELRHFFTCLARTLSGAICDSFESPALERVPFHLGYIELPVLSEVALTWRCNLRCRFCYASYTCTSEPAKEAADPGELTTGEVKRLLDIIRHRAEVPSISFTGGEPVLRDDLEELVAYASLILDMRVNLITNGSLVTPAKARALKRAGLASAQVSIESPDPGIHEALVDARNAHARSVSGLIALRDAGIPAHPHATLCRANMDSLDGMASFARSLGVDRFSLNMIIPAGRGVDRGLAVKYSEVKEAVLRIKTAAEREGVRFLWYSPTPVCLFNPISHDLGNKGCSACEGLLSVDPYGRLLPCSSWKEPVGDLLREDFNTLWFGTRARFLRKKGEAHPLCRKCEHFAVCHGGCPLYFKTHGHEELESARASLKLPSGRTTEDSP